jgi:hypothetical protein
VSLEDDAPVFRPDELASLVEAQLDDKTRLQFLVRGMHIEDASSCERYVKVVPLIGTRIWLDLRGSAAPRLTTDRRRAFLPEDEDAWKHSVRSVIDRWLESLQGSIPTVTCQRGPGGIRSLEWVSPESNETNADRQELLNFVTRIAPTWINNTSERLVFVAYIRFSQTLARQFFTLTRNVSGVLSRQHALKRSQTTDRAPIVVLARQLCEIIWHDMKGTAEKRAETTFAAFTLSTHLGNKLYGQISRMHFGRYATNLTTKSLRKSFVQ